MVLAYTVFFGVTRLMPRNGLSATISEAISVPMVLIKNLGTTTSIYRNLKDLLRENQALRAELAVNALTAPILLPSDRRVLLARVYSAYPFNDRGFLNINVGSLHGVQEKVPVTVGGNLLFGVVDQVFKDYSIVRTMYDPEWKLPVKLGARHVDALLKGGREPRLTLIVRGKPVTESDAIYSASRDFPYGLAIGEVGELQSGQADTFDEAPVVFPYELTEVNEVYLWL